MKTLKRSLIIFSIMSVLLCGIYPVVVMGISQMFFAFASNGELLEFKGSKIGSELIAQEFTQEKFFWGRPSSANYQANASSGSNYSLTNEAYQKEVSKRKSSGLDYDLLTASGSGLDPHISPKSALFQVNRVALARGLKKEIVLKLIAANTLPRQLGFLGEERVNVLKLNLDLENEAYEK